MAGKRSGTSDWRSAHGTAAKCGALVVLESGRDRPLRPALGSDPGRSDRDASGRFKPGNRIARTAKVRAGPRGALATLDAKADPAWRAARAWARRAAGHRIAELAQAHGGELSAGVCALVTDEWELRGDARYLAARGRAEGNPDLSKAASTLLASARQAGRDAWELAAREAAARPRDPADHHRRAAEMFAAAPVTLPAAASADTKTTRGPSSDESRSEGQPEVSNRNSDTGATGVQE